MFLQGAVSYAQAKGPRKFQEDYLLHLPFVNRRHECGHLLGVMDGHSSAEDTDGGRVAKYCAETIPMLFDHDAVDVRQELRKITAQLNASIVLADSGSTLSLAYVNESSCVVTTAMLGDSPIIIVDNNGEVQESEGHDVRTNLSERSAAIMRGAIYHNGRIHDDLDNPGLQMSRVLGDQALGKILDRTPSLRDYRINSDSVVIVASDGVFDPRHWETNGEALDALLAATGTHSTAVALLLWREKEKPLRDNTSIIMWKPRKWWDLFS